MNFNVLQIRKVCNTMKGIFIILEKSIIICVTIIRVELHFFEHLWSGLFGLLGIKGTSHSWCINQILGHLYPTWLLTQSVILAVTAWLVFLHVWQENSPYCMLIGCLSCEIIASPHRWLRADPMYSGRRRKI